MSAPPATVLTLKKREGGRREVEALGDHIKREACRQPGPHMLIFRGEWLKPIRELTSQELGDYRSWLRRNLSQVPADERRKAKAVLQALTEEAQRLPGGAAAEGS